MSASLASFAVYPAIYPSPLYLGKQLLKQCGIANCPRPDYFDRWCNIKELYHAWAPKEALPKGMKYLLKALNIPLVGTHHLGMHDVSNIANCVIQMITKRNVVFQPTKIRETCKSKNCDRGGSCAYSHPTIGTTVTVKVSPQKQSESDPCIVCLSAEPTHAVLPCLHLCLCLSCSTKFGPKMPCPKCRVAITSVGKIYK